MNERKLIYLSVLLAFAVILALMEIVYPLVPFLRFDLSEVIVLAVLMLFGLKEMVLIVVLKSVVRLFLGFGTESVIYGLPEIIAICAALTLGFSYYFYHKLFKKYLMVALFSVATLSIVMTVLNFFIFTPIFISGGNHLFFTTLINDANYSYNSFGEYTIFIIGTYIPFNVLKGVFVMTVFYFILNFLTVLKEKEDAHIT